MYKLDEVTILYKFFIFLEIVLALAEDSSEIVLFLQLFSQL